MKLYKKTIKTIPFNAYQLSKFDLGIIRFEKIIFGDEYTLNTIYALRFWKIKFCIWSFINGNKRKHPK